MEKNTDNSIWPKKHLPRSLNEIAGQDEAIQVLRGFIKNYKKSEKRAAILYGPSGSGKTSSLHAIANELNLEIIEINASDFRNRDKIDMVIGNAIRQGSIFGKGKLILIDEIDGIAGREDFGGITAVAKIIDESPYPIIMTANFITNPQVSYWDSKFNCLKSRSILIQYNPVPAEASYAVLKRISVKERVNVADATLKTLARHSGGDLRAAITDLQALTHGKGEITKEDIEGLAERKQIEPVSVALLKIFKTTDLAVAINAFDDVEEDIDKLFFWIDENIPKEYTNPKDLARAYDVLSRADVLRGRIRRRQHWRFQSYIMQLISGGVALAKDEKSRQVVTYKQTTRLLKLWQAGMKYQRRKAIAEKLSHSMHASSKAVLRNTLPYLQTIFKNSKSTAKGIAEQYELSREEIEWLKCR